MAQTPKITTGANDRARDETIGQTGAGLPDDSGEAVTVDEAEAARIQDMLTGTGRSPGRGPSGGARNVDEVPPDTQGAAENICRRCSGSGLLGAEQCPDCGGTGMVTTPVGGAG
jgi:hypothetical protein